MYEFWYDYDYIYKGITKDVETRFDTSNDELDRPLSKNKRWIDGKIMSKFVGLREKTYSYLIDDDSKDKKAKGRKKYRKKKT